MFDTGSVQEISTPFHQIQFLILGHPHLKGSLQTDVFSMKSCHQHQIYLLCLSTKSPSSASGAIVQDCNLLHFDKNLKQSVANLRFHHHQISNRHHVRCIRSYHREKSK